MSPKHPTLGAFISSAIAIATTNGVTTEAGMMAYVVTAAKAQGMDRDEFTQWCQQVWDASDGERFRTAVDDIAAKMNQS